MEPFQFCDGAGVPCFFLSKWEKEFPHLSVGMSARGSGRNYALHVEDDPDHVIANRKALAEKLHLPFAWWTCGEQVHGVDIREVRAEDRGRGSNSRGTAFADTDGLVTREPGVWLTSFYADCVPLIFYSPDADVIGIAHAGWRGTVSGIGPRMVRRMVQMGADVKEIRAAIAPSIGGCCYEVDERVAIALQEVLPSVSNEILMPTYPGKWKLDLRLANRELLLLEGILPEHVEVTQWCTSCHPEYFFSYRRDKGKTGRMVAWIAKRDGRDG